MQIIKLIFMSTIFSLVMVGCGGSTSNNENKLLKPAVVEESKLSNWYIQLIAEDPDRALISTSSQLGVLDEANAVQNHTLKALDPFDGNYVDIVFVNPDGVDFGNYRSNFHVYEEGVEDRWRFVVRTNDINAKILLTWRGLFALTPYTDDQSRTRYDEYRSLCNPLIDRMKLVDVDTGTEIAAIVDGEKQTYVLNMNGQKERVFEWVVQNDIVSLSSEEHKLSTLNAKSIQRSTTSEETAVQKRVISFDLSKPPAFIEVNNEN